MTWCRHFNKKRQGKISIIFLQLHRVTWWTKDDVDEPELSSDEEDEEDELTAVSKRTGDSSMCMY
jgi:hypothetical protein